MKQLQLSRFSTAIIEDEESSSSTETTPSYTLRRRHGVRNVAIVAHVDHGKTTLVDELLKTASASITETTGDSTNGSEEVEAEEILMDSGELEK